MSLAALHTALNHRDVDRAWAICCRLDVVPLRFAVRLVALLADENDPRYYIAVPRFLIRVLERLKLEREALVEFKKLADITAHVHHYYWQHEARMGLQDVVHQLHQWRGDEDQVRLVLDFDSVAGERRAWR